MSRTQIVRCCMLIGVTTSLWADTDTISTEQLHQELHHMKQTYEARLKALEAKESNLHPSGLNLPEVSVIVNAVGMFSDDKNNHNRGKVRVPEAELGFQGPIAAGIYGHLVMAWEQEYDHDGSETSVDLEEAVVSFTDLPGVHQLDVGRHLVDFGQLNAVHPHHWLFADRPLVMTHFMGSHNWFDDGVTAKFDVPNPWHLPVQFSGAVLNGRSFHHDHGHSHGVDPEPLEWQGTVYTGRLAMVDWQGAGVKVNSGFSYAWDSGQDNELLGGDLSFHYDMADSQSSILWQNELLYAESPDRAGGSFGLYSLLAYNLDDHWQVGGRYDWSQALESNQQHASAMSTMLSYYFSGSAFVRTQYRYSDRFAGIDNDHTLFFQFVWALGSHCHSHHRETPDLHDQCGCSH